MEQTRDLARTRESILRAARAEFAAHGLSGARCDAIAARAGVNKRMLFYCFQSKEKLYREILRRKFLERAAYFDAAPEDMAGAILHWYETGAQDLEWVRLLEWEALSTPDDAQLVGEAERRAYLERAFARLRRTRSAGRIPAGLNVAQLHLSIIALTLFPLAFPQMTRLATGLAPTDPRFRRDRLKFLRWLGARLAEETRAPRAAAEPRGKQPRTARQAR